MHSQDHDRLITKLESQTALSDDDKDALRKLPLVLKTIPARGDIVRDGERATHCCLLLEGWLHRYKGLPSGQRQVLSYHVPGDIPDFQSLLIPVMDHTLAAIVESRVAFIPHQAVHDLVVRRPTVAFALWRETLIDGAIFREWIVNVGARAGTHRIGHLICELYVLLKAVGLVEANSFMLLLTQAEIGDATGMSAVHVNRCVQELRSAKLIETKGRTLNILDWPRLKKFSGFDPRYLQLRGRTELADGSAPAPEQSLSPANGPSESAAL